MKNILYFSIISIFLLTACSLQDWTKAINNTDKIDPTWDVNINIPIYSKTENLKDHFNSFTIDPYIDNTTFTPLALWPVPVDNTQVITQSIPLNTLINLIDFNGDNLSDFNLEGIYSTNASLKINIYLTDGVSNFAVLPSELTLNSIDIEGVTYTFSVPNSSNNILTYTSNNFLDPVEGYYLDFGGGDADYNDLDISFSITAIGSGVPRYSTGPYTLVIEVVFNVGSDFGIVGDVTGAVNLIQLTNIPLDMSGITNSISNLQFDFVCEGDLPFDLDVTQNFYGSNLVPIPNSNTFDILSGVMSIDPINLYNYASSLRESTDEVLFEGNISNYGNFSMDYNVQIPATNNIRISNDATLTIKLYISADVTIDL